LAQGHRLVDFPPHVFGNALAAADHADADIVLADRSPLLDHVLLEQVEEEFQLLLGAFPILAGEAVQCDLFDAQPSTLLGDAPHRLHAVAVPSILGSPWRWAQRPLPSMMMAMCRGILSGGMLSSATFALVGEKSDMAVEVLGLRS